MTLRHMHSREIPASLAEATWYHQLFSPLWLLSSCPEIFFMIYTGSGPSLFQRCRVFKSFPRHCSCLLLSTGSMAACPLTGCSVMHTTSITAPPHIPSPHADKKGLLSLKKKGPFTTETRQDLNKDPEPMQERNHARDSSTDHMRASHLLLLHKTEGGRATNRVLMLCWRIPRSRLRCGTSMRTMF